MPQNDSATEFYNRLVDGKDRYKEISLEHGSGARLEEVQMHPVPKTVLASVIERLPDEMFAAVEEYDNADEAEEAFEEQGVGISAITEQTVSAFEDLVSESLLHPDLTPTQMNDIVEELSFEVLFNLGSEIMEMSFEGGGDVKDFHARD